MSGQNCDATRAREMHSGMNREPRQQLACPAARDSLQGPTIILDGQVTEHADPQHRSRPHQEHFPAQGRSAGRRAREVLFGG
jgi:hypothetical protein